MAYLLCIVVSIAMIWYSLIALSYCNNCTEIPLIFFFLTAFCLIIAYSGFRLFKMTFPARSENYKKRASTSKEERTKR
jgi:TRAP-type C4-dicarboxylate transport system permease small subunit